MPRPGKKQKTPPILSHEFFIVNHVDIISCVCMIPVVGLMIQASSSFASNFITMHHHSNEDGKMFTCGWKDLCSISFYSLIAIIIHAIIQEYILDKISHKLHLSKTKLFKFSYSGQFLLFFILSIIWGCNIIISHDPFLSVSHLWTGYPHPLSFVSKFYFVAQLAYWIHTFPELYFQKVKREYYFQHIQESLLALLLIGTAYFLNFHRFALVALVLHYLAESCFHAARLLYYSQIDAAKYLFTAWRVLFVGVRLISVVLAVLTFWTGLSTSDVNKIDFSTGNFNTFFIRCNALAAVIIVQLWFVWNFINVLLKRRRVTQAEKKPKYTQPQQKRRKHNKAKSTTSEESDTHEKSQ